MKPLICVALLSLPVTLLAEGGGLPSQPYIYVQGKAEIEKPANTVALRFNLVARNADQAKANQQVQSNAAKILGLLNARKIAQNDVIAADLTSEPEYEAGDETDSPRKRGKLVGYKVTRDFNVKVKDVTAFSKIVNELLAIGGIEFSGIQAELSNEKQIQSEVWEKAIADAREQAEKTVKAAGMKIDSVFALSPILFSAIQSRMFPSDSYAGLTAAEESPAQPNPIEYRLPSITVGQTIHVIYLISPAK
jgi:uncharacterized protein YggE